MRDVTISRAMNGFIANVGCQTLVFNTREELIRDLDRYLADPQAVEREFVERFGYADDPTAQAIPAAVARDIIQARQARRNQLDPLPPDAYNGGCGTTTGYATGEAVSGGIRG